MIEAINSKTRTLAAEIQKAIKVLLTSHQIKPQNKKLVDNLRDSYICL